MWGFLWISSDLDLLKCIFYLENGKIYFDGFKWLVVCIKMKSGNDEFKFRFLR